MKKTFVTTTRGLDDLITYATRQFQQRIERLERARGATQEEIDRVTREVIEQEDA